MTGLAAKVAVPAVIQGIPWKLIGWAALVFAFLALFAHDRLTVAQNGKLKAQIEACTQAREADRKAYSQAQQTAAAENKAHVAEVEQQYQRNSEDARQSYLDDLARLRAERMRQVTPANQGASAAAGSSETGTAAAGADGDGLRLSTDEYLQAQEIELRLMHLQRWVEQQLAVDPNETKQGIK